MKRVWMGVVVGVAAAALCACGGASQPGATATDDGPTGSVHLNLGGGMPPEGWSGDGPLATIAIRNVFDHSQVFLVDCMKKDHKLQGEDFCDELQVLPPGVYEIIVQPRDRTCHTEKDHYKVIVKAKETVERKIKLVCGEEKGGLDVIVKKTEPPVFQDIDFRFCNGDNANKFICRYGPDVKVTLTVTDSDTDCETLFKNYQWLVNGKASPINPPITGTSTSVGPHGECLFTASLDSSAPGPDYDLTLAVSDCEHTADFTFPIHLIDCDEDRDHMNPPTW